MTGVARNGSYATRARRASAMRRIRAWLLHTAGGRSVPGRDLVGARSGQRADDAAALTAQVCRGAVAASVDACRDDPVVVGDRDIRPHRAGGAGVVEAGVGVDADEVPGDVVVVAADEDPVPTRALDGVA